MYDDCELPQFCNVKEIKKSRKEHKCCECGDAIPKGSAYVYIVGKWDGRVDSYYQHSECAEACRAVRDSLREGCIPFGSYWEWLGDSFYSRATWNARMRKSLAVLLMKHKSIYNHFKENVVEDDHWVIGPARLPAKKAS